MLHLYCVLLGDSKSSADIRKDTEEAQANKVSNSYRCQKQDAQYTHRTMWERTSISQEAEVGVGRRALHTAFVRVSAGKARQGVVNIFGSASLNNFRGPELQEWSLGAWYLAMDD